MSKKELPPLLPHRIPKKLIKLWMAQATRPGEKAAIRSLAGLSRPARKH